MATESCACGALNSSSYLATRLCGGNYSNGAMWGAQDVSRCSFSNSTLELCQASEVHKGTGMGIEPMYGAMIE